MQEQRFRPAVLTGAMDDIAVEVCHRMRQRGLSLTDVARLTGWRGRTRRNHLSRYLRGEHSDIGVDATIKIGEAVGVPMRLLVGDEAREPLPQIAAPSMVPDMADLAQVAA